VFEDDRRAGAAAGARHPFDDPARAAAPVLLVNRNFGCGSSREHAPQALARWGVRAIVGESFAEIFFSNAVALGVPCVAACPEDVQHSWRWPSATPRPRCPWTSRADCGAPAASRRHAHSGRARSAFLAGTWDATALLTAEFEVVRAAAARLPYLVGFPPAIS